MASQTTLLSTELNSLANNATTAAGPAFDNTQGATGDGYTLCDVQLTTGTVSGAFTAGSTIDLWLLGSQDGSTYEDGSNTVTPNRLPDVSFPVRAVTGAQKIIRRVELPWGKFKALALNNGTGQTLNASGNTIIIRPATRQGV